MPDKIAFRHSRADFKDTVTVASFRKPLSSLWNYQSNLIFSLQGPMSMLLFLQTVVIALNIMISHDWIQMSHNGAFNKKRFHHSSVH